MIAGLSHVSHLLIVFVSLSFDCRGLGAKERRRMLATFNSLSHGRSRSATPANHRWDARKLAPSSSTFKASSFSIVHRDIVGVRQPVTFQNTHFRLFKMHSPSLLTNSLSAFRTTSGLPPEFVPIMRIDARMDVSCETIVSCFHNNSNL